VAVVSGVSYAFGYLSLRARAWALGTDPPFGLVDEMYVFAGFRFFLSLLVALLILLPVLFVVSAAAIRIGNRSRTALSWLGIAILALAALAQLQVLGIHGLLLDENAAASPLGQAALSGDGLALALWFMAVAGTALSILWLIRRRHVADALTGTVGIVAALNLLFLPAIQGILFADRYVRVLDSTPAVAAQFVGPAAIVDRGGGKAVLLGYVADGHTRLITVDEKELNGIGVGSVMPIDQFLKPTAATTAMMLLLQVPAEAQQPATPGHSATQAMPSDRVAPAFWRTVVGQLKHTLKNIGSLGEGGATQGRIFVALLGTQAQTAHPLSADSDLSWPVMAPDGTVYALRVGRLGRLGPSGKFIPVGSKQERWMKLIGVGSDGSVLGLMTAPPFGRPAMLVNGRVEVGAAPTTAELRRQHGVLIQESREYDGGRRLQVARSERGGRGFDVYYSRAPLSRVNVSDCGNDLCGQPSLSADGSKILFIRLAAR
jgi:hypothetical protein